jgi:hypothetical protein
VLKSDGLKVLDLILVEMFVVEAGKNVDLMIGVPLLPVVCIYIVVNSISVDTYSVELNAGVLVFGLKLLKPVDRTNFVFVEVQKYVEIVDIKEVVIGVLDIDGLALFELVVIEVVFVKYEIFVKVEDLKCVDSKEVVILELFSDGTNVNKDVRIGVVELKSDEDIPISVVKTDDLLISVSLFLEIVESVVENVIVDSL